MTDMQLPEPGLFGRRATRWAVIRGLVRTVLLVLVALLLLSLVVQVGGWTLLHKLGRHDQMNRVGVVGFWVGHPGLEAHGGGTNDGVTHVSAQLSGSTTDDSRVDVTLRMNLFGDLSVPLVLDPLDRAILGPGATKAEARTFLARLPSGVLVDAVIDLTTPLRPDQLPVPAVRGTVFYSQAFEFNHVNRRASAFARPVTWSDLDGLTATGPESRLPVTFESWTSSLQRSDDDNLRELGLPSSRELKALAAAGVVRAVYVRDMTPQELAKLLTDPRVRSFTPSAVRFALPAQGSVH